MAGKLNWVAGVVTRLRWAVACVYAVLYRSAADVKDGTEARRRASRHDQREKRGLVATRRCRWALQWIAFDMDNLTRRPRREADLASGPPRWAIVADASPWGAGAVLYALPAGVPLEFWATAWDAAHTAMTGIRMGDSASQAPAELMAILLSIHVWGRRFASAPCGMEVRSDSMAAVRATERLAGSSPWMNFLAADIALKLEALSQSEVQVVHVPGALNGVADALSRLAEPGKANTRPAALRGAKERAAPTCDAALWGLPPPTRGVEMLGV